MKVNPRKYTFRVASNKFLGFMVTHQGIEAKPKKIWALLKMSPLRTWKEVQHLTNKVAALSWFVLRVVERYMPYIFPLKIIFGQKI